MSILIGVLTDIKYQYEHKVLFTADGSPLLYISSTKLSILQENVEKFFTDQSLVNFIEYTVCKNSVMIALMSGPH